MESFTLLRKHLAITGIISQTQHQKWPFNGKNSIVVILAGTNAILYAKILNKTSTFQEYTDLIYNIVSACNFTIIFLSIVGKTSDLFEFINKLDDTVKDRLKCPEQRELYNATSQRIQKWMVFVHFLFVKVLPLVCAVPSIIVNYFMYFATDLGNDAFKLPYQMWFPFDTQTPIGHLVAMIIEYVFIVDIMAIIECFVMVGIATLPVLFTLGNEINGDLNTINIYLQFRSKRSQIVKQLPQLIQFHSDTIQLANDYSKLMEIIFTMIFLYFTAGICGLLLLIQMQMHQDSMEVILLIFHLICSVIAIFGFCEFGQRVGAAFETINIVLGNLKWYWIPSDIQRMLVTILIVAQEPVELDIFGSISCNRKTFKEVCNKAYSSFMILQRLES